MRFRCTRPSTCRPRLALVKRRQYDWRRTDFVPRSEQRQCLRPPSPCPAPTSMNSRSDLIVRRRSTPADGVVVLDLAHPEGEDLPPWEPGAHIDLVLGDGLTRQYSLCGDPRDAGVWRVGVLLDPNSRGGSRHVHDNLAEGATVRVRGPRNHFPLVDAPRYRFIAGGIGITPIAAMIAAVQRAGSDWTLLYGGRTKASMAFADELATAMPTGSRCGRRTSGVFLTSNRFSRIPRTTPWCTAADPRGCSPRLSSTAPLAGGLLHIERFAAKAPTAEQAAEALDQFEVVCQRSGVDLGGDVATSRSWKPWRKQMFRSGQLL